jgi:uncharacterized protein with HEPN domain
MGDSGRSLAHLLTNIVLWGERLSRFVAGVSKEEFGGDELRQAGASKCVEVIGEASGDILRRYQEFASRNPDLALAEAYRMRNRLSHGYDTIDWEILWDTAANYVPHLVEKVRTLLARGVD